MKAFFKKIIGGILHFEARTALLRYKPKIIAVVGTVGKTSTKDAIALVLSHKFFVRKSEKSFNSELGVPLSVLGLPNEWESPIGWLRNILEGCKVAFWGEPFPELLVLELGVDRPGDMRKMAAWIHPDIVVLTRFGQVPAHVEFFHSPEALIAEKSLILQSLKKDGVLILNADDEKVMERGEGWKGKTVTFGASQHSDVKLENISFISNSEADVSSPVKYPSGTECRVRCGRDSASVRVFGTVGKGIAHAILAAMAVSVEEGIDPHEAARSFQRYSPPNGRMRILSGVKGATILDDTYNSSPAAAELAIETLSSLDAEDDRGGRKIAVLGDMMELGKYTREEHYKMGLIAGGQIDILLTVGIRARAIAEGALDAKMNAESIYQFDSSRETGGFLQNILREGDLVLVKGSQSMRMERVVEEIMQNPEKKSELLVRQGEEWERR